MRINQCPPSSLTIHRYWVTDLLLLTIGIGLFYTFWLGVYPLFTPDEGRYAEVAREMLSTGDYVTPRVNGVAFLDKPILHYWLQAAAIRSFGLNEWAIRFFPALFGLIGCLVTYSGGRLLFDRRTALLSTIILATTPLYFCGAHYANLDLEVAVLITCTLLCLIIALKNMTRWQSQFLFAAYFFAALAFLTKGLIGMAFPSLIGGTWIILTKRWDTLKKLHLPLGVCLFILITLPWYLLAQQANPAFLHFFFVKQQMTRFLSTETFNNKTPFWFYLPILLVGFFPWSIFLVQAIAKPICLLRRSRTQHETELFLLLWLLIIFIFFSLPHSKMIGYIFPLLPALALLVGHDLSSSWEKAQRKTIYWGITNFILLSSLLTITIWAFLYYEWFDVALAFVPYIVVIVTSFLVSAVISLLFLRTSKLFPLFTLCTACSMICLLIFIRGIATLNENSSKPLATRLKAIIQPHDEIITYFKYYQDLPLYLERQMTVVADWNNPDIALKDNWVREFWYGMKYQKTDTWLINQYTFWQRWHTKKRLFVFLSVNDFDQFKQGKEKYYLLGQHQDMLLLSNQPTLPPHL
jgi:4-amino-4-deoxy-L-arabinose transferase-like glycosyltransferase